MNESFQAMLARALTATEAAPQCAGLDYDAEHHRLVGKVPMVVRNLHNLAYELAEEQQALLDQVQDNDDLRRLRPRLRTIREQHDIVSVLRWNLLREEFPAPETASGVAILHDWQVAHTFSEQEESMPSGLREFLQGLGVGDVHVIVGSFGRS